MRTGLLAASLLGVLVACSGACGGQDLQVAGSESASVGRSSGMPGPLAVPPASEVLATPLIEIGAPDRATAFGDAIVFDGAAEGLGWPSLSRAVKANAKNATRVVVAAPRNARVLDVLRAAWTLHDMDVEVQTLGPGNEVRSLVLAKRPAVRPDGPTCHAAVFVSPEGKLRVALPGGSVTVRDTDELLASFAHGARTCAIRWLAFGAETNDMAWGWVFDAAAQTSRAAPAARIVLGEPLRKK